MLVRITLEQEARTGEKFANLLHIRKVQIGGRFREPAHKDRDKTFLKTPANEVCGGSREQRGA